jgi:putative colanic acid biosynthesis glycosyltransferase
VLAQTYRNFEWLVVDGYSTDGTVEWLRETLGARGSWSSEHDHGLYDAMNKGLERAAGDYVLFLNSGDRLVEPTTLEHVAGAVDQSTSVGFLYGDSIDVFPDGSSAYRPARSHETLWRGMFTSHQSMFFCRERIGALRHRIDLRYSADYDFVSRFLRCLGAPSEIVRIDRAISAFALGGVSGVRRLRAVREDDEIRRTVLDVGKPMRAALVGLHVVHHFAKRHLPSVTRAMRYTRRPAP